MAECRLYTNLPEQILNSDVRKFSEVEANHRLWHPRFFMQATTIYVAHNRMRVRNRSARSPPSPPLLSSSR